MTSDGPVLVAWARTAVVPRNGAFGQLSAHEIAAPVVRALLARSMFDPSAVDAVVCGNALGAGGNPARMLSLAAGLPDATAALSVDTQCCSGLDAVAIGAGLIATQQAQLVVAGGVEAWSRAPIRQRRPGAPNEPPASYDRPPFAPDMSRDPDLALAAARYAARERITRTEQDAFAIGSHAKALAWRERMTSEVISVATAAHDTYARALAAERAARMPIEAVSDEPASSEVDRRELAVSRLSIAPEADGAALVLMAEAGIAQALGTSGLMRWCGAASLGVAPEMPMLGAIRATVELLARYGVAPSELWAVELHEAFAVQALAFAKALGIASERLNRGGGGLARGHPIGASGAISLVRLLADMERDAPSGALGLACIAAAGGLGSAVLVKKT
ncbi:MAG: thiolase family protein [Proteobacteria bacterium]|nr:thiolase family protein [Pseudomonadota bacterium]